MNQEEGGSRDYNLMMEMIIQLPQPLVDFSAISGVQNPCQGLEYQMIQPGPCPENAVTQPWACHLTTFFGLAAFRHGL